MPAIDDSRIELTPPNPSKETTNEGYRGIFTLGGGNGQVPKWLPISLIAFTTAALAVPIVVLRRQRAAAGLGKTLTGAPPPPRRSTVGGDISPSRLSSTSTATAPPPRRTLAGDAPPPRRTSSVAPAVAFIPSKPSAPSSVSPSQPELPPASNVPEDNFDGAFYTMKAFGLATLYVTVGAGVSIWGIKSAMGVRDTKEFAERSRAFLLEWMPKLSRRIYRRPEPEDGQPSEPSQPPAPRIQGETVAEVNWTWPDAERRLKAAYEKDGFMGWAEAAMQELEAEGQVERAQKGHA